MMTLTQNFWMISEKTTAVEQMQKHPPHIYVVSQASQASIINDLQKISSAVV
jgi:hypothetical protein